MITVVWTASIMGAILIVTFWKALLKFLLYLMPIIVAITALVVLVNSSSELEQLLGVNKGDPKILLIIFPLPAITGIFLGLILWTGILNPIDDWDKKNWDNFMRFLRGERFNKKPRKNTKVMRFRS